MLITPHTTHTHTDQATRHEELKQNLQKDLVYKRVIYFRKRAQLSIKELANRMGSPNSVMIYVDFVL